ncbi:MAG: SCP2 sterol-binding domain-containing protein [Phaeodactylibacter sp.]|nr:SCP2 sterol-binding domain-containing protein [Phaeodactylibacter sp.]
MTAEEFIQSLPARVDKGTIAGMNTNFYFDILGDNPTQYSVLIEEGEIRTAPGKVGDPTCTVTAKEKDLVAVVTGKMAPAMALMMGKVKVSNLNEMMKFAKIFGMM